MNPQLQQALSILKQKRDQLMGGVNRMNQEAMSPEGREMGMDMAMQMVTGGVTNPVNAPSLKNPNIYGQRDQIGRILNPSTLSKLQQGVLKGKNSINDFGQLSNTAELIEKGKDTPDNLRTAMELLKVLGLFK